MGTHIKRSSLLLYVIIIHSIIVPNIFNTIIMTATYYYCLHRFIIYYDSYHMAVVKSLAELYSVRASCGASCRQQRQLEWYCRSSSITTIIAMMLFVCWYRSAVRVMSTNYRKSTKQARGKINKCFRYVNLAPTPYSVR